MGNGWKGVGSAILNVLGTLINPATEEKQDTLITEVEKLVGFAVTDNLTITKTIVGVVKTFVFTNGVKTKTVVINPTTGITTITWS